MRHKSVLHFLMHSLTCNDSATHIQPFMQAPQFSPNLARILQGRAPCLFCVRPLMPCDLAERPEGAVASYAVSLNEVQSAQVLRRAAQRGCRYIMTACGPYAILCTLPFFFSLSFSLFLIAGNLIIGLIFSVKICPFGVENRWGAKNIPPVQQHKGKKGAAPLYLQVLSHRQPKMNRGRTA